jgi:hypothetical protein
MLTARLWMRGTFPLPRPQGRSTYRSRDDDRLRLAPSSRSESVAAFGDDALFLSYSARFRSKLKRNFNNRSTVHAYDAYPYKY